MTTLTGINAAVRSGEEVCLATEISLAATGDPTYCLNQPLFDSGWSTTLGRAIASWAGVELENKVESRARERRRAVSHGVPVPDIYGNRQLAFRGATCDHLHRAPASTHDCTVSLRRDSSSGKFKLPTWIRHCVSSEDWLQNSTDSA